jgi:hypothetical protein
MGVIKAGRMRCAKVVAFVGAMRNLYRDLVGKPEGERPVGRPTGKFEDKVKVDFKEMGWSGVDCINLAQDNDTCVSSEHENENSGSVKCVKFDKLRN